MKKILLTLGLFCSLASNAQLEFNHSGGATYMLVVQKGNIGGFPGATYNPRLDYVISEIMSVSLTTYPTIAANTQLGYLAIHAPIVAQFNMGNHASSEADSPIGFFANAGMSFGAYSDAGSILGPCFGAGVKFGGERSYGIRFELVNGKKDDLGNPNRVYSIGILYNFMR